MARGELLAYLNPVLPKIADEAAPATERRVVDRDDMQLLLFPVAAEAAADGESRVE